MADNPEPRFDGCSQCSRAAVAAVNDIALCVNCYHQFQVARTLDLRAHAMFYNLAAEQMDYTVGFGPTTPKMQVPDIPRGPVILNNIKVSDSVVGSINTGTVEKIDVNITYLKKTGSDALSAGLKRLTEAIANDTSLPEDDKDRMLDQVSFISEQAVGAAKDRRPGMLRAAFESLNHNAPLISAVADAWTAVGPLIKSAFGIG